MISSLTKVKLAGVLLAIISAPGWGAERICESPNCLIVENVHSDKGRVESIGVLDTQLHLYIYVPNTTQQFTLSVYDQNDDVPADCDKPSRFILYRPDGVVAQTLQAPKPGAWSDYTISPQGKAGIWRLTVTGPENRGGKKARNAFRVRTVGQVDLYIKPEAVARVRGLRFGSPRFGGRWDSHRFAVAIPGGDQLRLNLLSLKSWGSQSVQISPPQGHKSAVCQSITELNKDDRLPKDTTFSTLDLVGSSALPAGFWSLAFHPTTDTRTNEAVYGFGIDGGAADGAVRVFFPPSDGSAPLLTLPTITPVTMTDQKAARLMFSPVGAEPPQTVDTNGKGQGTPFLLPGNYKLTVTRGPNYQPIHSMITSGQPATIPPLLRRVPALPGWFAGDPHCHTTYYDGTDTPSQMVSSARSNGLDWVVVSEHGHGPSLDRVERANREASTAAGDEGNRTITVIPGMEFTTGTYHANLLGGFVRLPNESDLQTVIAAAKAEEKRTGSPVVVALNHPSLGKTATPIARKTAETGVLSLLELWNSAEPAATQLWWDLLNDGHKVFAETGSDSHNRINAPLGRRQTYVYLGKSVTRATPRLILQALRQGHSFLSQGGATLDFTLENKRPGETLSARNGAMLMSHARIHAAMPVARLEIIHNGNILHSQPINGNVADISFPLPSSPGWYLAQVWDKNNRKEPVALCNPVFVTAVTAITKELQ